MRAGERPEPVVYCARACACVYMCMYLQLMRASERPGPVVYCARACAYVCIPPCICNEFESACFHAPTLRSQLKCVYVPCVRAIAHALRSSLVGILLQRHAGCVHVAAAV